MPSNSCGSPGNARRPGARVPTAIGLGTNLPGRPDDLVRTRLRLYRDPGITTLRAGLPGSSPTATIAQLNDLDHLLDLVRQVNNE